jgi:hypothetical protein
MRLITAERITEMRQATTVRAAANYSSDSGNLAAMVRELMIEREELLRMYDAEREMRLEMEYPDGR